MKVRPSRKIELAGSYHYKTMTASGRDLGFPKMRLFGRATSSLRLKLFLYQRQLLLACRLNLVSPHVHLR